MDEKSGMAAESQIVPRTEANRATLTPLVRSALHSENVEVTQWECEQLHAGVGEWTAVYRLKGHGLDEGRAVPWSLILKTLHPQIPGDDLSAWNYTRREADAYQSGWFDDLPGGLAAPRCFGVIDHDDGTCWMWLEDIRDEIGARWPLEHYRVVARHLGQFNGAYLVDRSMPSWSWLSSGWLRAYIAQAASTIPLIQESLEHPLIRRWLPGEASEKLFRLWEERDVFLDALDRLPQTLCHLDVFRRNMFARKTADGDDQTVVVDWSFAGRSAIGTELVALVQASVSFFEVDPSQVQELEELVFEGYLEGLRDVGWRDDPQHVRLGYTAASLRYRFGDIWRFVPMALDESMHSWFALAFGYSVGECCDYSAQMGRYIDSLLDEARALLNILD